MRRRIPSQHVVHRLIAGAVAVVGAAILAVFLTRTSSDPPASMAPTGSGTEERHTAVSTTATTVTALTTATTTAATTNGRPLSTPPAPTDDDREIIQRSGVYRWLWTDPANLRVMWQDDDGTTYGQLQAARSALEQTGEHVVAITNGGIYRPGLIPLGLYVENGVERTPLNRASGSGNFFLMPNGVFWVEDGRAGIETTESYASKSVERTVDSAIQSGPMLVVDSAINERFSETSTSTYRRNAIGVDATGQVLLIMADRPVTLWEMAARCLELGAVDALYLDGTLSRLEHVVDERPIFPNLPVATMIAVVDG